MLISKNFIASFSLFTLALSAPAMAQDYIINDNGTQQRITQQRIINGYVTQQTVTQQRITNGYVTQQPVTQQRVINGYVTQQPVIQQRVINDNVTQQPVTRQQTLKTTTNYKQAQDIEILLYAYGSEGYCGRKLSWSKENKLKDRKHNLLMQTQGLGTNLFLEGESSIEQLAKDGQLCSYARKVNQRFKK